jgi:hypothetical protein
VNPPVVKLSSLDVRIPDFAYVEFQLCYPPQRPQKVPVPFFATKDIVECERKAAELNRSKTRYVFSTVWRDKKTNHKLSKWGLIRKNTTRTYTVCIPGDTGLTHDEVIDAIRSTLTRLHEDLAGRVTVSVAPEAKRANM